MIKILTEGSSKNGFGHIIRCLTLVNYCRENNLEYRFYIDGDESSAETIKKTSGSLVNWKNYDFIKGHINDEDIVFTDSYHASLEHYEIIRSRAKKLLIIDDLFRLPYNGYTIINPNFAADLLSHDVHQNKHLYGEGYVLLRSDFIGQKNKVLNNEVERVLVTLGGSDVLGLTPSIINYLSKLSSKVVIDVIVGFGYSNLEDIEKVSTVQVNLHYNVSASKMARLMSEVDFGICGAGQTVNEMLKIGCPGCFVEVIDNQRLNADYISESKRGLVFSKDDFSNVKEMFKYDVRNCLKQELRKIENNISGASELFKYIEVDTSGE